ncbi:MAG: alpha-amylase family glycosyl hydrolase [Ilumatobacteraceae bacterium]
MDPTHHLRIHAPGAQTVVVWVQPADGSPSVPAAAIRDADGWSVRLTIADGDRYWLVVDDGPPLLDPHCRALVHTDDGPRSVWRAPWAVRPQGAPLASPPVVYELHVRGFARTFAGVAEQLGRVVAAGANVVELMPIHPFDPSDNYWGYMPLVWGAVHAEYADDPALAAEECAALISAAHERGLHVWVDVVFNHTGEGDASMPTRGLRGLDDAHLYRHHADGRYVDDSGCGNDIDPSHAYVRHLIVEALDRYADLGVDGFRFDLASLLTRDGGGLVRKLTDWAAGRGVTLIAEPWDLGSYQVGSPVWPASWLQWNDRFRDDVRGFLRGEGGLVGAIRQRVQGSPDLFGEQGGATSLNFVTAHDGLTLHDLTLVTSDRHRSWDCGDQFRPQQLQNYFTLLLLSAGTPMWVMGDEFARTQGGHDNPYNIDGPTTWVDWGRATQWAALTSVVRELVGLRQACPPGADGFRFYGVGAEVDESYESRSIAWSSAGLYVMVNAWWEPLTFEVQEAGPWQHELATAAPTVDGPGRFTLAPRSIVVLRRT